MEKTKTVSMRITEQLNHFLDTRVLELKAVAEKRKGLDKTWLMLRLMELGQDWLAAYHLGQPTDFEEWLLKEVKDVDKKLKKVKDDRLEGYREGLLKAHELFEKYEDVVCKIGDDEI